MFDWTDKQRSQFKRSFWFTFVVGGILMLLAFGVLAQEQTKDQMKLAYQDVLVCQIAYDNICVDSAMYCSIKKDCTEAEKHPPACDKASATKEISLMWLGKITGIDPANRNVRHLQLSNEGKTKGKLRLSHPEHDNIVQGCDADYFPK